MVLRKYRSITEVEPDTWLPPLDPDNLRRAFELSDLCTRLSRVKPPRGVMRFRSMEEARADRARWPRPGV